MKKTPTTARIGPDVGTAASAGGSGAKPPKRRQAGESDAFRNLTTSEFRALEAKGTSEEAFRKQLRRYAKERGFLVYHTKLSLGSDPGFPDEVFLRGDRMVIVECKRVGKDPTPIQETWLAAFRLIAGAEVYVFRPDDWDEIYRVLA